MRTGRTLQEVAAEIERQKTAKMDFIADTRSMTFNAGPSQSPVLNLHDRGAFPINQVAHAQIADRIGIPQKYYDRMRGDDPELLAYNVNRWFQRTPERRLVRTLDGNARAFLSDRYQRIDNWNVANVVLPEMQNVPGLQVRSCEITESHLYIKATSTEITAAVRGSWRVGDLVEAGVMVQNSEIGLGRLYIKPFFNFLSCLNGAVRDSVLAVAHLGRRQEAIDGLLSDDTRRLEDTVVLAKVRDVLRAAFDAAEFQKAINKMEGQIAQRIEGDPVKAIEVLGEELDLTHDEQSGVLRHLIEGGNLSRYALMNAVTRTADDVESYDRATALETAGGAVLDLPEASWRRVSVAH